MFGTQVADFRLLVPAIAVLVSGSLFSLLSISQFLGAMFFNIIVGLFLLFALLQKTKYLHHLNTETDYLLMIILVIGVVFALQIMILLQIKANVVDPLVKMIATGQSQLTVRGYITYSPQAYGEEHNDKSDGRQIYLKAKQNNCVRGSVVLKVVNFHPVEKHGFWHSSKQQLKVHNFCIDGLHRGQLLEIPVQVPLPIENRKNHLGNAKILVRQLKVADLQQGLRAYARGKAKILRQAEGIAAFNHKLAKKLTTLSVGKNSKQLLPALLLGDRSQLGSSLISSLKAAGLIHIVCLSGMHLNIIVAILKVSTGRLGYRFRFILQILMVLGFWWLVGGGPSVIRAALMAIIVFNAEIFGGGQSLHSLFLVVILMVVVNPNNAYSLGFLYSVLATFGILLGSQKITKISQLLLGKISDLQTALFAGGHSSKNVTKLGIVSNVGMGTVAKAIEIMGITLLANFATLPLNSYYQGRVNLLSPLANLLVLPLLPIVILAGLILLLIPTQLSLITVSLGKIIEIICVGIIKVAEYLGETANITINPN